MGLLNQTQQEYYNSNDYGGYQFITLENIINQFMFVYVGEDKIIPKARKIEVAFHAQRAMQELSFDTFKSCKSQEVVIPASLQMILPQDYVNYTKISYIGDSGIKHPLYPTKHTSNPQAFLQDDNGDFILQAVGTLDDSSENVVLTAEHKDIVVGMLVKGPYIGANTFVGATSNSSSITTITLHDSDGNTVEPDESLTNATLTFENAGDYLGNGTLIKQQKSSHIVENLTWKATGYPNNKITANAADDITDIKVGMLVSHDHFPVGTTVINIDGTTIIVSNDVLDFTPVTAGEITFIETGKDSTSWENYKSTSPSENDNNDYEDEVYWPFEGERYGLEPSHAQVNGSFYIDCNAGKIHFSSNISGKTVVLDYISDGLGTDEEMQVHKFAEEAMYKYISHAILSSMSNIPEYQVARLKKEKFAAVRTAKLRLSNIKLEEITRILRGKSKHIKH
tara:strand:+ start:644 stop:1999 length:1356 start_codon:yes stop_codon:yes gene_type:complete